MSTSLFNAFADRARIDAGHAAEMATEINALLAAAVADVLAAAAVAVPDDLAELPADLAFAVTDHAAMLFEARASVTTRNRPLGLSLAASRITARYRGIRADVPESAQDGSNG